VPIHEDILLQTDTAIDHYEVVERQYEGRPSRVLFSGSRRAAQSGIGLDDDPDLLFDYNQRLLELASNLYPAHILMIGGGAFTLPMALTTALPDAVIDVVELDPGLQPIAEQYFGLQPSERLRLHFGDGRQFLETSTEVYDLIIIDVFSELSIPRQFLTMECVQLLHARLSAEGSIAMNIIAAIQGHSTRLIKCQLAAYRQIFTQLDVFPAAHGLTNWLPQNLILVAQKGEGQDLKHFVRFSAIDPPQAGEENIVHDTDFA
jgi:hypothetical protein